MNASNDFLAAIWERPQDDLPRLVYADWLEEQGEIARAEFIRGQCELYHLPYYNTEAQILRTQLEASWKKHGKRWKSELPKSLNRVQFERGFPAPGKKHYTWNEFQTISPEVLAAAPSLKIESRCSAGDFVKVVKHPFMQRVSVLEHKCFAGLPARRSRVWAQGEWLNLSQLRIRNQRLDDEDVEQICASAHRFSSLRRIGLGDDARCTDRTFDLLAESDLLNTVTHLELPRSLFSASGFSRLVESGRLENCQMLAMPASLQTLDVDYLFDAPTNDDETRRMIRVIQETSRLPRLTRLTLDYYHAASADELFTRGVPSPLKEIHVNRIDKSSVYSAMQVWPNAKELIAFKMWAYQQERIGLRLFMDDTYFPKLQYLFFNTSGDHRTIPELQEYQTRFGGLDRQRPAFSGMFD